MTGAAPSDRGRVLVLGASGFLGANVVASLAGAHEVVAHLGAGAGPTGVEQVRADLTDPSAVVPLLDRVRPALVINCAALADVDRCESERDRSLALNLALPDALARACARRDVLLVHVSTDAVFAGTGGPYREDSPPDPVSAYGRDKRAGEDAVLAASPTALVARTNIVGWSPSGRRSLLEFFHARLVAGERAPGFTDILFRPLPVQWFWPVCAALLDAGRRGVVHATGPELLSKHAFGRRVATVFGLDPDLVVAASGLTPDRPAARAPVLDVLPSTLPSGASPLPGTLDEGLAELRDAAARGGARWAVRP